jgi:hypothetical protein
MINNFGSIISGNGSIIHKNGSRIFDFGSRINGFGSRIWGNGSRNFHSNTQLFYYYQYYYLWGIKILSNGGKILVFLYIIDTILNAKFPSNINKKIGNAWNVIFFF